MYSRSLSLEQTPEQMLGAVSKDSKVKSVELGVMLLPNRVTDSVPAIRNRIPVEHKLASVRILFGICDILFNSIKPTKRTCGESQRINPGWELCGILWHRWYWWQFLRDAETR
jgi:hypothetical protein